MLKWVCKSFNRIWQNGQYVAKINHSSLDDLLKILGLNIPGLPKDPLILLGTVTSNTIWESIQQLSGGYYYQFGIAKWIVCKLNQRRMHCSLRCLKIQINVDGVSSKAWSQFWPIQGMIDLPEVRIPMIQSNNKWVSKPCNLDFLADFVSEHNLLQETGFHYH